jgi:hypothetical protein
VSRGHGSVQRAILDALERYHMEPLCGDRVTYTAQLRAAKVLERQGLCVLVRLRDDDGRTRRYAARPGLTIGGKDIKELSVEPVTGGGNRFNT